MFLLTAEIFTGSLIIIITIIILYDMIACCEPREGLSRLRIFLLIGLRYMENLI